MKFVDQLIDLLHEGSPGTLTPERLKQYARIFGTSHADDLESKEWFDEGKKYFEDIRDQLLQSNERMGSTVGKLPVIQVNNNAEITGAKTGGAERAIVVDTFVTTLLWTMNKGWYYGQKISLTGRQELFCKLYLHFATLRKFGDRNLVWPRPKTPPHQTEPDLNILTFSTRAQEMFLIGHELAHFYVDAGGEIPSKGIFATDFPTSYTSLKPKDPAIDQELLADELSFEYTLKVYQQKYSRNESVEVVAVTSIFLLIRYHLWLSVVCSTDDHQEDDFVLWFGRNSLFREKARQICSDEILSSIVQVSEILEEALEPAALRANEAFKVFAKAAGSVT